MKYKNIILFLFLISKIYSVDIDVYTTEMVQLTTHTYKDIYGLKVQCPNSGVMKNFKVLNDGSKVGFEYVCYSSKYSGTEYDESILKSGFFNYIYTKKTADTTLAALNMEILCPVDYALNSFVVREGPSIEYDCINVKPSYQTKGLPNNTNFVSSSTINTITVGLVEAESQSLKGAPLRGFQLVQSGNYFYFKFGYLYLKDVEKLKRDFLTKSAALRDENTQKY